MKNGISTIAAAALVAALPAMSAAFAGSDGEFFGALNAVREASVASFPRPKMLGLGYLPKMTIITEDQATKQWAENAPSAYGKQSIISGQNGYPELWARLQQALNASPHRPLAVVWDYFFLQRQVPAYDDLARLFSATPFPLVIGVRSEEGAMDPRIYADGPQRYQGHIWIFPDNGGPKFAAIGDYAQLENGVANTDSLAVAATAAVLAAKRHVSKEEAWRRARTLAVKVATILPQEFSYARVDEQGGDVGDAAWGIRLIPRPFQTVSMKDVILKDPAALKKLDGAIVLVADALFDNGDILGTGKQQPQTYIHAWTILQLLGSEIK